MRAFGVSKPRNGSAFSQLYLHDGGHDEGVLLSKSKISNWTRSGRVKEKDTVVFEVMSVMCVSSTILNL